MIINTTYRSNAPEIMDDFGMEGDVLRDALDKIAKINKLLGGNKVTLQGIETLLRVMPGVDQITIVDIGCGNGDMLRQVAKFGISKKLEMRLIGIDANEFTIEHARKLSLNYRNIEYICQDIFKREIENFKYDIALCTLTLHHFTDHKILRLMRVLYQQSNYGIIVNDLHRSKVAYRLFQLICQLFSVNEMPKNDGLLSILKGFRKNELVDFSERLNFKKYTIRWKWAFRYQWIVSKI